MRVYEVSIPEGCPVARDGTPSWDWYLLILLMFETMMEANLALHRFEGASESYGRRVADRKAGVKPELPRLFMNTDIFLNAKSFLTAADTFAKALDVLEAESENAKLAPVRSKLDAALPDLREIRNSNQHVEDRIRHIGSKRKLLPEDVEVVLGTIHGDAFLMTLGDGRVGRLAVTAESMEAIRETLELTIQAFKWLDGVYPKPVGQCRAI